MEREWINTALLMKSIPNCPKFFTCFNNNSKRCCLSFWKLNSPLALEDQEDLEDPEKQHQREKKKLVKIPHEKWQCKKYCLYLITSRSRRAKWTLQTRVTRPTLWCEGKTILFFLKSYFNQISLQIPISHNHLYDIFYFSSKKQNKTKLKWPKNTYWKSLQTRQPHRSFLSKTVCRNHLSWVTLKM